VKLGMLSNGPSGYTTCLRDQGVTAFFGDAFVIGDVGLQKPDVDVFHFAARRLGVEAGACLMIDDQARNIEGANAAGLHTHFYGRRPRGAARAPRRGGRAGLSRCICADLDRSALRTAAQESYAIPFEEKRVGTRLGNHALLPVIVDFRESWPFVRDVLDGTIMIHYLNLELISPLATSMRSGGTLLIETIQNRGGNYLELPVQGQVRSALAEGFTGVEYMERVAGSRDGNQVTVRTVARRR
jgi:haloacid dehalogenase-like hydrolase